MAKIRSHETAMTELQNALFGTRTTRQAAAAAKKARRRSSAVAQALGRKRPS